jgi:hypothetical protein
MARSSTSHTINAARFRLGRVQKDWGEIAAILRQEAAEADYAGPCLAAIERLQIGNDRTEFLQFGGIDHFSWHRLIKAAAKGARAAGSSQLHSISARSLGV